MNDYVDYKFNSAVLKQGGMSSSSIQAEPEFEFEYQVMETKKFTVRAKNEDEALERFKEFVDATPISVKKTFAPQTWIMNAS